MTDIQNHFKRNQMWCLVWDFLATISDKSPTGNTVPNFRHNSRYCFPARKPLWGESVRFNWGFNCVFLCLGHTFGDEIQILHRFFPLTLRSHHAASPSQLNRNHPQPCGIQWDLNTSAVQRRPDTGGAETMLYVCHGVSSPFHPNWLTRWPGDRGFHWKSVCRTLFWFLNPTTGFSRNRGVEVEVAASPPGKKSQTPEFWWRAQLPN